MLVLHHLEHSRSIRILWALEELGVDYQVQYYQRLPNMSAPPELKKIHPLGKAPILTDKDKVIAESAVILNYLQKNYDTQQQFKPQKEEDAEQYDYWMHYAEGSFMPYLVFTLVLQRMNHQAPFVVRPMTKGIGHQLQKQFIQPRLNDHIAFIEQYLSQHPYFAGEQFSFADIQMAFALQGLVTLYPDYPLPQIRAYLQRLNERAAYRIAQQKIPDHGKPL